MTHTHTHPHASIHTLNTAAHNTHVHNQITGKFFLNLNLTRRKIAKRDTHTCIVRIKFYYFVNENIYIKSKEKNSKEKMRMSDRERKREINRDRANYTKQNVKH